MDSERRVPSTVKATTNGDHSARWHRLSCVPRPGFALAVGYLPGSDLTPPAQSCSRTLATDAQNWNSVRCSYKPKIKIQCLVHWHRSWSLWYLNLFQDIKHTDSCFHEHKNVRDAAVADVYYCHTDYVWMFEWSTI